METKIISFEDPLILHCIAIRRQVFIEEQSVPEAREQDGLDPIARHYLFLHQGRPIGTARSRIADKKIKIERFAFLKVARGLGLVLPPLPRSSRTVWRIIRPSRSVSVPKPICNPSMNVLDSKQKVTFSRTRISTTSRWFTPPETCFYLT